LKVFATNDLFFISFSGRVDQFFSLNRDRIPSFCWSYSVVNFTKNFMSSFCAHFLSTRNYKPKSNCKHIKSLQNTNSYAYNVGAIGIFSQFHQYYNTQLLWVQMLLEFNIYFTNNTTPNFTITRTQLEVTLNFHALCSSASKISVNILAQKLFIERWWNWHLVSSRSLSSSFSTDFNWPLKSPTYRQTAKRI